MKVFVLSRHGRPLMPTKPQKARKLLEQEKAIVVRRSPFTIKLNYHTGKNKQEITLGVDAGYAHVGFSAVTEKEELTGGELNLLAGMSKRLTARRMYRRNRRTRLRYRKPGFLKSTKSKGWMAPSINHKMESHIRLIEKLKRILPITETIVEVAAFDIQKINNPPIAGTGYQNGVQAGWQNVREYVFHRDHQKCQNPACKNRSKNQILQVHHIGFWRNDRTSRPANLITLCTECHTPANHQPGGLLYNWEPALKTYRNATFMTIVRWKIVNQLNCLHTYGHITKNKRIELGLDKSHHNDAFVIANGTSQQRATPFTVTQRRRNNRSLEKFYDAKYADTRDGKTRAGKDLDSQKRTRSRENLPENLRVYRQLKLKKGRRAIRRQRYFFQPGDLVRLGDTILTVKGTMSNGKSILLSNKKTKTPKGLELVTFGKGLALEKQLTC